MANEFSADALSSFVDFAGSKGLMNKATAAARKAAVKRISAILEPHEAQDVSKLDLEAVMRRFSNLEGSAFTPQSLATYASRFRSTLEEFLSWKQDPMAFRPTRGASARRSKSVSREEPKSSSALVSIQPTQPPQTHSLPIPIRSDLTVFVHGVPFDLSQAEAKRIANVIVALAIDPEPREPKT